MSIGRILDLSSAQHPPGASIDWAAVKAAGVTTAIIKATEGTGYTNPFYAQDVAGAKSVGIDVLAYHFASWGLAAAEVEHFISVAGNLARVLDIETGTNVTWIRAFLQGLGVAQGQCMTYGSASTLKDIYAQIPSLAWPAAYGQNYPGWGVLWQFTSSATVAGISGNVDESRWYGTETQYDELFEIYDPTPPQPSNRTEKNMLTHDPKSNGYWGARSNGSVYTFDGAPYIGPLAKYTAEWGIGTATNPVVGIAADGIGGFALLTDSGGAQPNIYNIPANGQYAK